MMARPDFPIAGERGPRAPLPSCQHKSHEPAAVSMDYSLKLTGSAVAPEGMRQVTREIGAQRWFTVHIEIRAVWISRITCVVSHSCIHAWLIIFPGTPRKSRAIQEETCP